MKSTSSEQTGQFHLRKLPRQHTHGNTPSSEKKPAIFVHNCNKYKIQNTNKIYIEPGILKRIGAQNSNSNDHGFTRLLGRESGTLYECSKNKVNDSQQLMINGDQMEPMEEFCYLGSILVNNRNCCKEVQTAKANLAFSELTKSWDYLSRFGCTPPL